MCRSRLPTTLGDVPVGTPRNVSNIQVSMYTPPQVPASRPPSTLGQFLVEQSRDAPNTSDPIRAPGRGAIPNHGRDASQLNSGMNARNQVAGNSRVIKNRSRMTQEEINRRCGVSKAVDDREIQARQILEERKTKAETEIREMDEMLRERRLDLEAIKARLASAQMSSAIVEGILKSQDDQGVKIIEGEENNNTQGEENKNTGGE